MTGVLEMENNTYDRVPGPLAELLARFGEVALAFSGGVDSSYLLYAAAMCADRVTAYYVKAQFQPEFELNDARRVAEYCDAELKVIPLDVLADKAVSSNPADRCYYCKSRIMAAIIEAAGADGYGLVIDGSNASDDENDRPGSRALKELGVRSPLRECGIGKEQLRTLAKNAGLHVWNKPAYACLATRIPAGEQITHEKLAKTECAETLLHGMGFRDFRVRFRNGGALVQVTEDQHEKALAEEKKIVSALGGMYSSVTIDTETR